MVWIWKIVDHEKIAHSLVPGGGLELLVGHHEDMHNPERSNLIVTAGTMMTIECHCWMNLFARTSDHDPSTQRTPLHVVIIHREQEAPKAKL